jgi:hypothetical protein
VLTIVPEATAGCWFRRMLAALGPPRLSTHVSPPVHLVSRRDGVVIFVGAAEPAAQIIALLDPFGVAVAKDDVAAFGAGARPFQAAETSKTR